MILPLFLLVLVITAGTADQIHYMGQSGKKLPREMYDPHKFEGPYVPAEEGAP